MNLPLSDSSPASVCAREVQLPVACPRLWRARACAAPRPRGARTSHFGTRAAAGSGTTRSTLIGTARARELPLVAFNAGLR